MHFLRHLELKSSTYTHVAGRTSAASGQPYVERLNLCRRAVYYAAPATLRYTSSSFPSLPRRMRRLSASEGRCPLESLHPPLRSRYGVVGSYSRRLLRSCTLVGEHSVEHRMRCRDRLRSSRRRSGCPPCRGAVMVAVLVRSSRRCFPCRGAVVVGVLLRSIG